MEHINETYLIKKKNSINRYKKLNTVHKKHLKDVIKKIIKSIPKILLIYCFLIFPYLIKYIRLKFRYVYLTVDPNKIRKTINPEENNLHLALCTLGKLENLYIEQFIEYYLKIGIDHIFIYDDNDPNTQKFEDAVDKKYKNKITIYTGFQETIMDQPHAFTDCYTKNKNSYDWFLMVDIDEYLYLVEDYSLKSYLSSKVFDKCDFIKFHWATSTDNNLVYYDNRTFFERFKPPYIKSNFVKTIVRGHISDFYYWFMLLHILQ